MARARCLMLLLFVVGFGNSPAAQDTAASRAGDAIRAALQRYPVGGARVGICVVRASDGQEIFARDADSLYEMASNAKLFTTAAALRRLGQGYRFRTRLVATGQVTDGVLAGDLVVVGGGDPGISGRFFGGDRMYVPRSMAQGVVAAGIRTIAGDLVMDDRFFDRTLRAQGWPEDESLWWYAAPVSALSYNDNCLDVTVTGGTRAGSPVRVTVRPEVGYGSVVSRASTCGSKRAEGLVFRKGKDGTLIIEGAIRAGQTRGESIGVDNPPLFFGAALRRALADAGVQLRGTVRLVRAGETLPPKAREIAVWTTDLTRAIDVANKRSQNLFAEMILKTLGAERKGEGTWPAGLAEVLAFCAEIGLPQGSVTLADGSGLSSGNRATPRAVVTLLARMNASPEGQRFLGSLAVNGDPETTLRNRLTEADVRGRIFAKTGTVASRGVSALSGYAYAPDGSLLVFSILTNGSGPGDVVRARKLEDAICRALLGAPAR